MDLRVLEGDSPADLAQESPSMRALDEVIERVAVAQAPVLILGETGVGKERVARAIHLRGTRRTGPFVTASVASSHESVLEADVFGQARIDSAPARRGLVMEAEGGTLLVDEIGEMPLALQARLQRFLELGEVRPVGSERARTIDARVIATSRGDVDELLRQGRLRPDLHYRLNVVSLVVPPLRERREDIPLLVARFLAASRKRAPGSPVLAISDPAMEVLVRAPWPGNVRELESTIERLVVLGRLPTIGPDEVAFLESARPNPWPMAASGLCTLKEMNRRYLEWVLAQTAGDKVRAAEILDIDLSTLYRWQRTHR